MQLRPFNVTLPWHVADKEQGTYSTAVRAESGEEAVRLVATEMADNGELSFDSDAERQNYIDALVADGGHVSAAADDLKWNLQQVFEEELFPNGGRDIDIDALQQVLVENRARFVVESKKQEVAATTVIDLDQVMWDAIKQAASKSQWMSEHYYMNDWVADVCRYLVEGPQAFLGEYDGKLLDAEMLMSEVCTALSSPSGVVPKRLAATLAAKLKESLDKSASKEVFVKCESSSIGVLSMPGVRVRGDYDWATGGVAARVTPEGLKALAQFPADFKVEVAIAEAPAGAPMERVRRTFDDLVTGDFFFLGSAVSGRVAKFCRATAVSKDRIEATVINGSYGFSITEVISPTVAMLKGHAVDLLRIGLPPGIGPRSDYNRAMEKVEDELRANAAAQASSSLAAATPSP